MGQYYTSILKDKNGNLKSYYGSGIKLMEHSYFFNNYVNTICSKIYKKPHNVAWVGDYAEEENEFTHHERKHQSERLMKHVNRNFMECLLINHTKKQYLDLTEYYNDSIINYYKNGRKESWVIHPLPLLTAFGNGLGGGDYRGEKAINKDKVGIWAGDLIEIKPYDKDYNWDYESKQCKYKDYEKITIIFDEGY